ncbi:MAG TPA: hypothetical protein PLZ93_25390 [Nocardioides sp.]|uniref:hypothetical protein n=1 Tax=uncultured Nocardioides sp. TaxID=198441 RepID=UPI000ED04A79|nr:hypothetical protein [uncultured Nocardioides sp.]HCB05886.1 hypothetical protein [Nocardioides sp.]HRI98985.1 hypothetical protein [Nocardioides sp.]
MSTNPEPTTAPRRRIRRVAVIATALALVGGGAAYAFWTTTGSGTGTAATGSPAAITVVQTGTLTAMYPGDTAQTLSGNFNNPNGGPIHVNTVTVSIASVTKAPGAVAGTCDATDYTLTGAAMTVNADVPAGNAQGSWSGATIKFNNKATSQDQCKGAAVNLAYTVS